MPGWPRSRPRPARDLRPADANQTPVHIQRRNPMTELNRLLESIHPVSVELRDAARRRIDHLAKPIGSLGKLESNAARLVQVFGTTDLRIRRRVIFPFAAEHGLAVGAGISL